MYMNDWIMRLDDFITMTGNELLKNAVRVKSSVSLKKSNRKINKFE